MAHCITCGAVLDPAWRHCASCGASVQSGAQVITRGQVPAAPVLDGGTLQPTIWERIAGVPLGFLAVGAGVSVLIFTAFNIYVGLWPGHPDSKVFVVPALQTLAGQPTDQALWGELGEWSNQDYGLVLGAGLAFILALWNFWVAPWAVVPVYEFYRRMVAFFTTMAAVASGLLLFIVRRDPSLFCDTFLGFMFNEQCTIIPEWPYILLGMAVVFATCSFFLLFIFKPKRVVLVAPAASEERFVGGGGGAPGAAADAPVAPAAESVPSGSRAGDQMAEAAALMEPSSDGSGDWMALTSVQAPPGESAPPVM